MKKNTKIIIIALAVIAILAAALLIWQPWKKEQHTLTYMVDGVQEGEVETYNYGDALSKRPDPTREGYAFGGWSELPATMGHDDLVVTGTWVELQSSAADIINAFENTGNIAGTKDFELSLTVDPDAIGQVVTMSGGNTNGMDQILKPITSVISNLKFHALLDPQNQGQLELKLKDTALATIGGKLQEDNTITVVTDMLPNYAIKADLSKLGAGNVNSVKLTEEEQKAIMEAIKAKVDKYTEALNAKMGEAEKGSWEFDGATFTEKKPVNVTTKEFTVMSLNLVKDIFTDPSLKKITDAMGDKFDVAKIDEGIANTEKKDDKEFPALTWYNYTNLEGNKYNEITMEKAETNQKVDFAYSLISKKIAVHAAIDANGKGTIEGLIDAEKLTASITADINANNLAAKIVAELAAQKDGTFTGTLGMSMNDKQVLGVSLSGKSVSETLNIVTDGEGIKVVPVEALSDGSSEDGKQLMTALQLALPGILQKAMQAMPDEINALVSLFSGNMQ